MRPSKLTFLLPLLLLLDPAVDPVHSQDAASELRRLSEAINEAKIQARFEAELTSYTFSDEETTVTRFRVKYAYPYLKRECIEGSGKIQFVVLEDGSYVWSYFPTRNMVVKKPLWKEDSPFPLSPTEDLSLLTRNYDLVIRGPVPSGGGMQCRIVEFIPRSADRPRREFWLEERWNLPVRVRFTSYDSRTAYMAELSKILWDPDGLDEEEFGLKVPPDTKVYEIRERENLTKEEAERLLHRRLVLPLAIPEGYRPKNIVVREEGAQQCLQVVYTDGLSSFSFFQEWPVPGKVTERAEPKHSESGEFPVMSTRQYGLMNVVVLPWSGRRAVIVGDIPKDRMMKMAESLRESLRESLGGALRDSFHQEVPTP